MKKNRLYLLTVCLLIVLTGCSGGSGGASKPWSSATKTPTPTPTPNPLYTLFEELNRAPEEYLETNWKNAQAQISEQHLEEKWDEFCKEYSAVADYLGSAVKRLRDDYRLSIFETNMSYPEWNAGMTDAYYFLSRYVKEGKVKPAVAELLYRPGCRLNLGGTLWLYEDYKAVEETLGQPAERKQGDPIRVLIVDCSETYENVPITGEQLMSDSTFALNVRKRAETLFSGLFQDDKAKIRPVSYPEIADVVIKITVTYPFNGTYYVQNGSFSVNVWNTDAVITAVNRRTGEEIEVLFSNKTPQSMIISEVDKRKDRFMDTPNLRTDNRFKDNAKKLTQDILAWFPDVK